MADTDRNYAAWTRDQLIEGLIDTSRQMRELRAQNEEYQWVEEALKKRTQELNERIKELDLLYGIAALLKCLDVKEDALLQAIIDRLPAAWQHPPLAAARIIISDRQYKTRNFVDSAYVQASPIYQAGKKVGQLQVAYTAAPPGDPERIFLKEEQRLLDAIAAWLGEIIERRRVSQGP